MNYEEIKKHSQRITKIKPFINKHKWQGINFPSEKDDWKKIDKNNVLYAKEIYIYILLMFQNITHTVKNKLLF